MAKSKQDAAVYVVLYVATALEIVPGVPQHNLTAEEWALIPPDKQQEALASGHYELAE